MAVRTPLLNYYEILGVPRDAGRGEIDAAFKAKMLSIRDMPGSGEQARRLNLAHRALSNNERRQSYDAMLDGVPPPSSAAEPHPEPEQVIAGGDPLVEEDEPAPRRRWAPLLAGTIGATLLLAAGLWSSGLIDGRSDGEGSGAANIRDTGLAEGSPQTRSGPEKGGLADVLASLLTPERPKQEQTEAAATSSIAPPDPGAPASTVGNGSAAMDETSAETADEPNAGEELDAPDPPSEEPEAARTEPPTTPAVDRSAEPRLLGGGLLNSDNLGGRFQGTVGVRLTIGTNGRAQGCRVSQSSGNATLDSTTCRLLQERVVFTPARDRDGNPIVSEVVSTHVWGRQPR